MHISKVKIKNFKSFKETFSLNLSQGLNILVGNNEAGKSTILEAINLLLSGLYNGRYFKNELSEYFFNSDSIKEYLLSIKRGRPIEAPEILIEVFISGTSLPFFEGDSNSDKVTECGVCLKIALDEKYKAEYEEYVGDPNASSLPIEYYEATWTTCAREVITPRKIPIKSALIDSSTTRNANGSDVYISHIIRNHLDEKQKHGLSQAHRQLHSTFMENGAVISVNESIKTISKKSVHDKEVKLSIDLSSRNAWENSFLTYVDDIPFQNIGKGEQSIVKTKLALEHKKAKEASIILIEEPENPSVSYKAK